MDAAVFQGNLSPSKNARTTALDGAYLVTESTNHVVAIHRYAVWWCKVSFLYEFAAFPAT